MSTDRLDSTLVQNVKRVRLHILRALLTVLAVGLFAQSAHAIPAFARRYRVPCQFCHDGYPKLSAIGEQFKLRGFRLEQETSDVKQWLKSVPVILRARVLTTFVEDGDSSTFGIFNLITAGNLNNRFSYWFDRIWVASDGDDKDEGQTDNAWLRFELVPEEFHLRGGRMELDIPFTQARTPNLFPYNIYFANTGFETDSIGQYHDGGEVGGFLDDEIYWSLAVVAGRSNADNAGFDPNLYGRIMRFFGENRAGAFALFGENTLSRSNPDPTLGGPDVLVWNDGLFRIGADGSFDVNRLNLYGLFMYGRNDNSIADAANPEGTEEPLSFAGGFLQGDYFFWDQLTVTARLDVVSRPPEQTADPKKTFVSFFPGFRIYLHPRVRLVVEVGFRNQDRPTVGAVELGVAF